jgi:hypothetical protein
VNRLSIGLPCLSLNPCEVSLLTRLVFVETLQPVDHAIFLEEHSVAVTELANGAASRQNLDTADPNGPIPRACCQIIRRFPQLNSFKPIMPWYRKIRESNPIRFRRLRSTVMSSLADTDPSDSGEQ